MLSLEEDVEVHALHARGWSVSAIARQLGRDRKTIRRYLSGQVVPGRRRAAGPDPFAPFVAYCRARLGDDPHLWVVTLLDELAELGYEGGYSTFTRALRRYGLRPHCEPCQATRGRDVAIIAHPPGEETQWDWLELPDPPPDWGFSGSAHLLVGALSHSGRWRGVLADAEDFPHLVEAIDTVVRALGGVTQLWRFDRMATVCSPGSGQITTAFAQLAKHYGVRSVTCPPRRGTAKAWWRRPTTPRREPVTIPV
ncbi:helix-turn-helix domain-containing protein [Pseudonocardia sp. NPDC046786]|uniref:helix-turn-helix domain-containing protein n=1 Tax=Pseudonocardia sp. NPDC046786 TaxID=3155471 RepID=UPI0033FE6812